MSARKIDELTEEASAARDRFGTTLEDVRARTAPAALADEAMDYVVDKGRMLASQARTMAAAHPLAIGAGIAAIGLALFTRHKLKTAHIDFGDDYTDYDDSFTVSPEPDAEDAPADNPLVSVLLGLAAGALLGALSGDRD
jgi:ElaB/YqjD/DUF883 family membrane-anchored ribosome-binding protein